MKKLLISLLLFAQLSANDVKIEKTIYESIFSSLHNENKPVIYSDSDVDSLGLGSEYFTLTKVCENADIVLMTQSALPEECQDKVVFGTRYRHLKKEYVIGAFFWQKGRPNIVFQKEKLDKHHIILTNSLSAYVE